MHYRFSSEARARDWLRDNEFMPVPGSEDDAWFIIYMGTDKNKRSTYRTAKLINLHTLPTVAVFSEDGTDHSKIVALWKEANTMDPERYFAESKRTAAATFFSENVSAGEMEEMLQAVEAAMKWANDVKVALFYNREVRKRTQSPFSSFVYQPEQADYLHGTLGLVTEAGETAQHMLQVFTGERSIDSLNIAEELGDVMWYVAIMCRHFGISLSQVMEANIAKLRKRYPDKFTTEAANKRDEEAERAAMEEVLRPKHEGTSDGDAKLANPLLKHLDNLNKEGGILEGYQEEKDASAP